MTTWGISVTICQSGDATKSRDWEGSVEATKVVTAIAAAIEKAALKTHERVHVIHIGPPRKG